LADEQAVEEVALFGPEVGPENPVLWFVGACAFLPQATMTSISGR
jgi:hypothetical protein